MKLNSITMRNIRRWAALLSIIVGIASSAAAQTPTPTPTPPAPLATPTPTLERKFIRNILHDEIAIFTFPLHLNRHDSKWLIPLTLSTGALITTDPNTARALGNSPSRLRISNDISYLGTYGAGGTAAAFYLVGLATHNARARETGLLSGEALIDASIVGQVLKFAAQRPRPLDDEHRNGDFFEGGNSFPSGHALAAWSVATVIAYEYKDHALVQFGAYGLAAAVSVARYTGQNHFLSDVLVGSAIGYGVGRYVYKTHHDPNLDGGNGRRTRSKRFPMISPRYNGRARGSGITLAWNF